MVRLLDNVIRVPLALWVLLAVSPGHAAPAPRMEASPRELLSGRDTQATLTVSGLPADARLACTAGQVRAPRHLPPDTLEATFLPPRADTLAPILCAAVSPSTGAHAHVVLQVWRQQVLPLTGLPPLGRVEVRIGGTLYGPVRANTTGQAEVAVLLTPDSTHATLLSTAPGQPPQERQLPLPVASRPVLLLLPEDSALEADGLRSVRVWAFGADARGAPLEAPLSFWKSGGSVDSQHVGPGLHLLTFQPPPRATAGEAVLTAMSELAEPATTRLALRPGVRPLLRVESALLELLGDGGSGTDITVSVRDERGRALSGQPVRIQAARGQVAPLQDRGDGTYLARYRAPLGGGEERLTAVLEGAPSATLALTLRPPPRLTLDHAPGELPADGLARLALHLSARDARGHPPPDGTELALSTTLGSLPGTVKTRGGLAQVEFVADRRAGEALIQAQWDGVSTQTSVRLVPGPAARLRLNTEEREVRCDGRDSARVHLLVQDAQGNPLEGVPITLSAAGTQAERGFFERVATLGGGEFVTRFHAPSRCEGGTATLLAAVGEARGDTRLVLAARTPRGLTVRLGAQSNLGMRAQPALEIEGDVRPYALGERLAATATLQVAIGRARDLPGRTTTGDDFSLSFQSITTTASVGARWHHPLSRRLSAYAGAGLDTHFVHLDWQVNLSPEPRRQLAAAFGVHARVGAVWSLGEGALVIQARYGFARLPSSSPFQGPVGGTSASFGYRFEF
ncbi:MAG: invasin domain 3-containing protein [Cystobacter sp.]